MGIIILLGIVAAATVLNQSRTRSDLSTGVEQLTAHIRYAQIAAQADIHEWRLAFINTTDYQLGPVVSPGAGFTPQNVPGAGSTLGSLTGGLTTAVGTAIRFDSWGRPMDDAGTLLTTDRIITLTEGGESQSFTIRKETGLIQ